ncbi:MAG: hypothetical protein V2J51_03590 [Erythrobacter sp.]|jgi:hypothetical protein|nr:hypothetical protein [Erythrobacter sp.]
MEIRSPLLSSKLARENLGKKADVYEINRALNAIDNIGQLYDALSAAQKSVDPLETPQARAMRYETQYLKATAKGEEVLLGAMESLNNLAATIKQQALFQAGLTDPPASAQEIRASLRSMSQADRDKAIADAFESNDREVLASIYGNNRVTWGGTTNALDSQFEAYVERNSPDARANREAVSKAAEATNLAFDTFAKSANDWRDPLNAAKGYAQQEEFDKADAALKAALTA